MSRYRDDDISDYFGRNYEEFIDDEIQDLSERVFKNDLSDIDLTQNSIGDDAFDIDGSGLNTKETIEEETTADSLGDVTFQGQNNIDNNVDLNQEVNMIEQSNSDDQFDDGPLEDPGQEAIESIISSPNASKDGISLKDVEASGAPRDQIEYLAKSIFAAVKSFEDSSWSDVLIIRKKARSGSEGDIKHLKRVGDEYKYDSGDSLEKINLGYAKEFLTGGNYQALLIEVSEALKQDKDFKVKIRFNNKTIEYKTNGEWKNLDGSDFEISNIDTLSKIYGEKAIKILRRGDSLVEKLKMYKIDYRGITMYFRVNSTGDLEFFKPNDSSNVPHAGTMNSDWKKLSKALWSETLKDLVEGD